MNNPHSIHLEALLAILFKQCDPDVTLAEMATRCRRLVQNPPPGTSRVDMEARARLWLDLLRDFAEGKLDGQL